MNIYLIMVVYVSVMNALALFIYHSDKRRAQAGEWRVSERALLAVAMFGGGLGAWIGMHVFHHKSRHVRFRLLVPLACLVWCIPFVSMTRVALTREGKVVMTPLMVKRNMESKWHHRAYEQRYEWVDYDEVAPCLVRAMVASEDNLFASHSGFSRRGIEQALKERRERGTVRHGGSTISQQTAKNMFTWGNRTWWRKVRETWYTLLIEHIWGKRRIMEVYMNVGEMGDGIYGAEAASRYYFHHSAKHLTASEAALLAAVLPSPRRYSVTNPGPYMRKRQGQILGLMPKMGKIEL